MSSSRHKTAASDKDGMSLSEKVRFAVLLVAAGLQLVYLAVSVQAHGVGIGRPLFPPNFTNDQWQGLGWAVIVLVIVGILLCMRRKLALVAITLSCAAFGLLFGNLLGFPEKHAWLAVCGFALFVIFLPSILLGFIRAKKRFTAWRRGRGTVHSLHRP
jgi:lysylphosphatidylglycerol synthetase-like protein (DUF2156 family)